MLGNLSLLGISYQGQERDREYRDRFSRPGEMTRVMRVALRHGVRLFAASSHEFNQLSPIYLKSSIQNGNFLMEVRFEPLDPSYMATP